MDRLLWIDLEMTGLDIEKEVIIEVAAIVTDLNFNELAQYETAVHQPQHYLDNMDDWNKEHHTKSGLVKKVAFGKDIKLVEKELCNLVDLHFENNSERPVIAGNSIGQDRLFINKYMPELAKKLHYRMLDVSSWKVIFNKKFGVKVNKSEKHRALDDVRESIIELKTYMSYIQK
ncbi:MAG: oligoribonuclease [Bdellovibrionia bacterium]